MQPLSIPGVKSVYYWGTYRIQFTRRASMREPVIVCVDDEDIILKSLKRELLNTLKGHYLIETVLRAEDALHQIKALLKEGHEVPLVIVDQMMPGMKGNELLRHIKDLSPPTLKILLTGQAGMPAVIDAVNHAGLYRYIAKPWEPINLAMTVKEALLTYQQRQKLERQHTLLRNIVKNLEIRVTERTTQLKAQQAELLKLNASKDKFFSIITHDLHEPFSVLLDIITSISRNIEDFTREEIEEHVDHLRKSIKTVYRLLKNLQFWSDLQRGLVTPRLENIALAPIIERHLRQMAPYATQKQIEFNIHVPQETTVYADKQMLDTIVWNLLSNAVKFTEKEGCIRVSASSNEQFIDMAISDNGVGIPQNEKEQLFRLDTKYSRLGTAGEEGTGLGLILCQELLKKIAGKMALESELGHGTCVTVQLPVGKHNQ